MLLREGNREQARVQIQRLLEAEPRGCERGDLRGPRRICHGRFCGCAGLPARLGGGAGLRQTPRHGRARRDSSSGPARKSERASSSRMHPANSSSSGEGSRRGQRTSWIWRRIKLLQGNQEEALRLTETAVRRGCASFTCIQTIDWLAAGKPSLRCSDGRGPRASIACARASSARDGEAKGIEQHFLAERASCST